MDTAPITGLAELDRHLNELVQDPNLTLNPKLFDDVELQLTESNIPALIPRFLPRLTAILKQYTHDPAAIVSLTIKLLGPISFPDILHLASPDELVLALDAPVPAPNLLALVIIHKAAARPADITLLSTMTDIVASFIHRWLVSPYVEVGQKSTKVLGDLLDIDCALPTTTPTRPTDAAHSELSLRKVPGNGSSGSSSSPTRPPTPSSSPSFQATTLHLQQPAPTLLAQGRVLRILPRLAAINFCAVSHSTITAPTPVHLANGNGAPNGDGQQHTLSPPRPGEGLLQYVALRMVEKSDALMHLSLVDFFETLVGLLRVTEHEPLKVEVLRRVLREATAGMRC
ncbi:hypothetical protein N0V88_007838 [Collariella sp. IMI 366227]|nr:hypothetical protein N0V88_007838 [Collariella sp. IMI 366227]